MYLLPVIPFITDTVDLIEKAFFKAKEINLDFIIFGGMTLKKGKQKLHFEKVLKSYDPKLLLNYANIYRGNKWGNATSEYYNSIHETFSLIARKYKVPVRIPPYIFNKLVNKNDLVVIILEHLDYLLKLKGQKSPYGFAAYSISQLKEPLVSYNNNFRQIKGVGQITA